MAFGLTPAGTITKEQTRLSIRRFPAAASFNILKGDVCFQDTAGFLEQAKSTTAAGSEWFVAVEPGNNSSGISGAISVPVAVKGHYVTVVADGVIQPGTPVKVSASTNGRVVAMVTGTDAEGLKVGIYTGLEGGTISKSGSSPYLESFTDGADFLPTASSTGSIIEILLR